MNAQGPCGERGKRGRGILLFFNEKCPRDSPLEMSGGVAQEGRLPMQSETYWLQAPFMGDATARVCESFKIFTSPRAFGVAQGSPTVRSE